MTRKDEREGFEVPTRVQLLETDMDTNDKEKESIRNELRALRMVLIGILVSVTTASVLLAVNVAISAAGGS